MLVDNDNIKNDEDHEGEDGSNGGQGRGEDPSQRWRALEKLVSRPSPFGAETGQLAVGEFEPFENVSYTAARFNRKEARGGTNQNARDQILFKRIAQRGVSRSGRGGGGGLVTYRIRQLL